MEHNNSVDKNFSDPEVKEEIHNDKIEQQPLLTPVKHHDDEENIGYPTLDKIINKLGYTNYHVLLIIGCCSFYFSEGGQLYAFNLLMPVFDSLLKLNTINHVIMNSICYFGFAIGSFFVGILTKNFNRKLPLLVFLSIYALFSVLIVFYQNFIWIVICRFIIGFCIGIISSLYLSDMSEFLPINNRGLAIGIVLCSYVLGIIFYVYSFKLIMPKYDNFDKWRIILLVISVPCIFATMFGFFIIRDSPRLLLNKDSYDTAIIELKILTLNSDVKITEEDEENLRKEIVHSQLKNIQFSFTMLFSKKFYFLTTINLLLLFTTSCIYVSNFFSLPLILYKETKQHSSIFFEIIIAQSFSIPAIVLASLISGYSSLGRKYTIAIGFVFCFAVSLFTSIFQFGLIECCSIINFFIMSSYFLSKVYLIESFPSKLRDHGMSVIFVCARLGEAFSPSICELMFRWYNFGPYVYVCFLSLIGTIASLLIPFETSGIALDSKI